MPFHVWRKIDPDESMLRRALDEAAHLALDRAGWPPETPAPEGKPGPQALPALAKAHPEGARFWRWRTAEDDPGVVLGAAWWADHLGRRHWLVEAGDERGGQGPHSSSLVAGVERPPLALIYPEQAGWWRERASERRWLVLCGCGACGTVEQLAWAGPCCGPCFDRHLDGETTACPPPAGLPARPFSPIVFDGGGRVIAPLAGPARLAAWGPPWRADAVAWQTGLLSGGLPEKVEALACDGQAVALVNGLGQLLLLRSEDGQALQARSLIAGEHHPQLIGQTFLDWGPGGLLAFAGPARGLLVRLARRRGPNASQALLYARDWDGQQGLSDERWLSEIVRGAYFHHLAVTPDGKALLLAGESDTIEWFGVGTSTWLWRLRWPGCSRVTGVVAAPDGSALAGGAVDGRAFLARWERPGDAALATWLRRLGSMVGVVTPDRPALVRPSIGGARGPGPLALSPDGNLLVVGAQEGVAFYDPRSLEELARFTFPTPGLGAIAFSPNGEALAVSGWKLVLWPVWGLLGRVGPGR
jgi:hypothetical protein